jgi:hypothetical protein
MKMRATSVEKPPTSAWEWLPGLKIRAKETRVGVTMTSETLAPKNKFLYKFSDLNFSVSAIGILFNFGKNCDQIISVPELQFSYNTGLKNTILDEVF